MREEWRRNADATDDPACSIASLTGRGFTGHEMLDDFCLINMNGRIYDPGIGHFLSADDRVPDPFDGRSYNRYSYLDNNPLNGTDPTGHMHCEDGATGCNMWHCVSSYCQPGGGWQGWGEWGGGAGLLSAGGSLGWCAGVSSSITQIGFCNNSGCSSGVNTEFTGGTSLNDGDILGSYTPPEFLYDSGPGCSQACGIVTDVPDDFGGATSGLGGGWYEPLSIGLGSTTTVMLQFRGAGTNWDPIKHAQIIVRDDNTGQRWVSQAEPLGLCAHAGCGLFGSVSCPRFRRHRVRCFYGTGGGSWEDGVLHASSSLRRSG